MITPLERLQSFNKTLDKLIQGNREIANGTFPISLSFWDGKVKAFELCQREVRDIISDMEKAEAK